MYVDNTNDFVMVPRILLFCRLSALCRHRHPSQRDEVGTKMRIRAEPIRILFPIKEGCCMTIRVQCCTECVSGLKKTRFVSCSVRVFNAFLSCPFPPKNVGRVGELGEQHPQRLCSCIRTSSRQNWNFTSAARGDIPPRESHRVGRYLDLDENKYYETRARTQPTSSSSCPS